jgi:putative sigma-54 modulation protein
MELEIFVQNMDLTPRLRDYVAKKTAKLDRTLPNLTSIRVDLATENTRSAVERQVAQITIRDDKGTILRAEERNSDMFAAIDAVMDKLNRQIERYRGKRNDRGRGGKVEVAVEPVVAPEDLLEEGQRIVRHKRFALHPMSSDEAVEQMELLGHDFFVFFNLEDNAINVLYRRHDGSYGLLQPELG